jgi:uncharacterized protein YndB with AHSA1/START domain
MTEELVKFESLGDSVLKAEIDIKATPDKVFNAWTSQEQLVKWFRPRTDGHVEVNQFDCTVGGPFDLTMVFADGDRVRMKGNYQEINPPNKIVFTWLWVEGVSTSNETLVTVDITPIDIGTRLTLTHERFVTAHDRDQHSSGWGPILNRLASILSN